MLQIYPTLTLISSKTNRINKDKFVVYIYTSQTLPNQIFVPISIVITCIHYKKLSRSKCVNYIHIHPSIKSYRNNVSKNKTID